MKVQELLETQTNEGFGDYIGGALGQVGSEMAEKMRSKGRQIISPFQRAHAAGKRASQIGREVRADRKERATAQELKAKAQADLPRIIQQMAKNAVTIKQIQAQLKSLPESVNEGLWDYLRGATSGVGQAAKQVGGAIKQQAQQQHQRGQRSSAQANLAKLTAQQEQLAKRLYDVGKTLGVNIPQEVNKMLTTKGQINATQQAVLKAYSAYAKTQQPQPSQQPPAQPPAGGGWTRDNMTLEPMN